MIIVTITAPDEIFPKLDLEKISEIVSYGGCPATICKKNATWLYGPITVEVDDWNDHGYEERYDREQMLTIFRKIVSIIASSMNPPDDIMLSYQVRTWDGALLGRLEGAAQCQL